ncbi:MAG: RecQ family ATP-dependent DNA helicase [Alistipes sp.]|jgi:ATP-dependent DNA helicase RecQ|nr:RecQ family ATP-dependent DNA helicase [Alistipes sp.]
MSDNTNHTLLSKAEAVLRERWGYEAFRPVQGDIITSVLSGRDTLALMPTGGGKSLTYQIPALMMEGLTIVVTPLIALMKDQVDQLRKRDISAVAVHSGMDQRRIEIALDNCTYGDVKLLYIAPERLATEAFRVRLRRMNISLVAVDEAHCISQWGYDFRPSYLRIAELREYAPNATFLALTASATNVVAKDIMRHLGFREEHILRTSFARPNLTYVVRDVEDKYYHLRRIIDNVEGCGIIYMRTREGCEQLTEQLRNDEISANFYHAGLPAMERNLRQDEWLQGRTRIIVATNAFGMGIDKADVRFVVHYNLCDSLEAYYQEAGRAGRDGKRSYAVLLLGPNDTERIERLFKAEFPPIPTIKRIYELICNYLQVAIGDGEGASFVFNIYDFCHRASLSAANVINALKLLEQNEIMTLIDEQDNPAKLMFCCSRDALYKINAGGDDMDRMLYAILRLYNGVFSHFRSVDELDIANWSKLSPERVHDLLKMLWRMHVIRYIPATHSPMIYFNTERLATSDIFIAPETYHHRYKLAEERFASLLNYVNSTDKCRSAIIEEYFGQEDAQPCGVCDICRAKRSAAKRRSEDIPTQILNIIRNNKLGVRDIVSLMQGDTDTITAEIENLLRSGKISITEGGKVEINE